MAIDREEGIIELENRGLTPITCPDPNNPSKALFFIENAVVWDKLFSSLEEELKFEMQDTPELVEFYNSIRHRQWIKRIITANNLKLEWMDWETPEGVKKAMAIRIEPLMERGESLPRTEENVRKWMSLVQAYITQILVRFEP